jgi:thiol-disulfide isomerase/thioredoxin
MNASSIRTILNFVRLSSLLAISSMAGLSLISPARSKADTNPVSLNRAAPELVGTKWINTPGNRALSLAARKGKVTIVEFWTYGCINCRRNLPAYARWHKQFAEKDVAVIGIHTPETDAEKNPASVARYVRELGIHYPVLLDTQSKNWQRWQQEFWPTIYLIDRMGRIRYRWEGELDFNKAGGEAKVAMKVNSLLAEK